MFMSKAISTSLRLSLNSRDELHASSPDDSLASLGITYGDLIFYNLDPTSQTLASNSLLSMSMGLWPGVAVLGITGCLWMCSGLPQCSIECE